MIVKSPLKERKTKPNVQKGPSKQSKQRVKKAVNGSSGGGSHGRRVKKNKKKSRISLPDVKPWKIILGAFIIGGIGILYLNHVFATQQLLREVQLLERQFNQTKRMHDDYRLTFDRMIGPAEIYNKAKAKGFINGGPAEKVIEVEE